MPHTGSRHGKGLLTRAYGFPWLFQKWWKWLGLKICAAVVISLVKSVPAGLGPIFDSKDWMHQRNHLLPKDNFTTVAIQARTFRFSYGFFISVKLRQVLRALLKACHQSERFFIWLKSNHSNFQMLSNVCIFNFYMTLGFQCLGLWGLSDSPAAAATAEGWECDL